MTAAGDDLANRDVVIAELEVLRAIIRDDPADAVDAARAVSASTGQRLGRPSSVDNLADGFRLTPFERSVLLLAAGPELVAAVAEELSARRGAPIDLRRGPGPPAGRTLERHHTGGTPAPLGAGNPAGSDIADAQPARGGRAGSAPSRRGRSP